MWLKLRPKVISKKLKCGDSFSLLLSWEWGLRVVNLIDFIYYLLSNRCIIVLGLTWENPIYTYVQQFPEEGDMS